MIFSGRAISTILVLAATVTAIPTSILPVGGRECCCCNPSIPAIVCSSATSDICICPAVACPPTAPKMKKCCCCDECSIIPYDKNCYCPAVVCPVTAVSP